MTKLAHQPKPGKACLWSMLKYLLGFIGGSDLKGRRGVVWIPEQLDVSWNNVSNTAHNDISCEASKVFRKPISSGHEYPDIPCIALAIVLCLKAQAASPRIFDADAAKSLLPLSKALSDQDLESAKRLTRNQAHCINLLHFAISEHLSFGGQSGCQSLDGFVSICLLFIAAIEAFSWLRE